MIYPQLSPPGGAAMRGQRPAWVIVGGLPCGAREEGPGEPRPNWDRSKKGRFTSTTWLLVNVMGQRLRQQHITNDVHRIGKDSAPMLGLCPTCLGFGLNGTGDEYCPNCKGSGRPALRVEAERIDPGGPVTFSTDILNHEYVAPRRDTIHACLACGLPHEDARHKQPQVAPGWSSH